MPKSHARMYIFAVTIGLVIATAQAPAHAATSWARALSIPVQASINVDASGCANHPGPYIYLNGTFVIGGTDVILKLDNNKNKPGIHEIETAPVEASLTLTNLTKTTFNKSPHFGGVTGNPSIYFQLLNGSTAVGSPVFIGKCVQNPKKQINTNFNSPALLQLIASALDCNNGGGNQITFGGDFGGQSGIFGKIILKGGHGKFTDETVGEVTVELNPSIGPFSKKGSDPNGVTGNPWVSLAAAVNGRVQGSWTDPVHCNQL